MRCPRRSLRALAWPASSEASAAYFGSSSSEMKGRVSLRPAAAAAAPPAPSPSEELLAVGVPGVGEGRLGRGEAEELAQGLPAVRRGELQEL
mmetsp:Transcript_23969/g.74299  ORF Transcript_23969/g.74299 Transcript_23969/m.74299 type:complete len:92 (-) Transcript_23969:487-762(-)